jgi:hypothetical protein
LKPKGIIPIEAPRELQKYAKYPTSITRLMSPASPLSFWRSALMTPLTTNRMTTSINPPTMRMPGLARLPGTAIAPPPPDIMGGIPPPGGGGGGGLP